MYRISSRTAVEYMCYDVCYDVIWFYDVFNLIKFHGSSHTFFSFFHSLDIDTFINEHAKITKISADKVCLPVWRDRVRR